jgi:hypothetical protein
MGLCHHSGNWAVLIPYRQRQACAAPQLGIRHLQHLVVLNSSMLPPHLQLLSIETEDLSEPEFQNTRVPGNSDPGPEISLTDVCQLKGEAHDALHGLIQVGSLGEGRRVKSCSCRGQYSSLG